MSSSKYVKADAGIILPDSVLGYKQVWDHNLILKKPDDTQAFNYILQMDNKADCILLLYFLLQFTFATYEQIKLYLSIVTSGKQNCDQLLDTCLNFNFINKFYLSETKKRTTPSDILEIYCLDHVSKPILNHFRFNNLIALWKPTNMILSPPVISKYLTVTQLYLSILNENKEILDTKSIHDCGFDTNVVMFINNRSINLSASIRAKNGFTILQYIVYVMQNGELPGFWRKKVEEQLALIERTMIWTNRYGFERKPRSIFIANDYNQAVEMSDIYANITGNDQFCVCLRNEIKNKITDTPFYMYDKNKNVLFPDKILVPIFA